MASGGYRAPRTPASVSGPGSLSRRTDGGPASQAPVSPPDARYGEAAASLEQQSGAPISASGADVSAAGPAMVDPSGLVPLDAPTQRPGEPVTAGATTGLEPMVPDEGDVARFRSYLPVLRAVASRQGSSPATRQYVRQLERHLQESGVA